MKKGDIVHKAFLLFIQYRCKSKSSHIIDGQYIEISLIGFKKQINTKFIEVIKLLFTKQHTRIMSVCLSISSIV